MQRDHCKTTTEDPLYGEDRDRDAYDNLTGQGKGFF